MKYAAFLRGVNVNGRKVLKGDLLDVFERLSFQNVQTFLQSGNVVFETDSEDADVLREQIEAALAKRFGMPVITFVYPLSDIGKVISDYPFDRTEDRHAYFLLTDGQIGNLLNGWQGSEVDQVASAHLGFYWSVPKGLTLDSPFARYMMAQKSGPHSTSRNLNTLEKMVAD